MYHYWINTIWLAKSTQLAKIIHRNFCRKIWPTSLGIIDSIMFIEISRNRIAFWPLDFSLLYILFRLEEIKLNENLITVTKWVYNHEVILISNPETVRLSSLYCHSLLNYLSIARSPLSFCKRICTDGSSVERCTLPTYPDLPTYLLKIRFLI